MKGTLKAATSHLNEFILFCYNLQGQLSDLFKSEVSKLRGIVWYGVPNATDIWQPVDSRFGQLLKKLTHHEQQQWLERKCWYLAVKLRKETDRKRTTHTNYALGWGSLQETSIRTIQEFEISMFSAHWLFNHCRWLRRW